MGSSAGGSASSLTRSRNEPRWAETEDACEAPIELSLNLLTALHARWVILLNALDYKGFRCIYIHRRGRISIDDGIQDYSRGRESDGRIPSMPGILAK